MLHLNLLQQKATTSEPTLVFAMLNNALVVAAQLFDLHVLLKTLHKKCAGPTPAYVILSINLKPNPKCKTLNP